jgi:hypothetical protein
MNRALMPIVCAAFAASGAALAAPPERGEVPRAGSPSCMPGFVALSGTRTCVKVSGRVRSEFVTGRAWNGGLRSEGRIGLDARTMTEHGPLRAVIRVQGRKGDR